MEALGEREAATLMEHLPPVGRADVATKRDLDQLEGRMEARFDAVEARMVARFALVDVRIDAFEERMDLRLGSLEGQLGSLEVGLRSEIHGEVQSVRADLERALRQTMQVTIGSVAAMLAVAVAVLGLLGAAAG